MNCRNVLAIYLSKSCSRAICLSLCLYLFACDEKPASPERKQLTVTATAYNSLPDQTYGDPNETAWGDRLEPGMKAIAVSRDLIDMGLDHQTAVKIEGLEGEYLVLDKMASRWQKRIDIYMGEDVEAAMAWGKRTVVISWESTSDIR